MPRLTFATALFLLTFCSCLLQADEPSRPNVLLLVTDDQGYGDIGALGNSVIRTPNMDRLHGESVRLSNFHVDPTCSPTRGALMTGKYSHRARVWHTIRGGNHLRDSETTMADVFKHSGYNTAMFGKWHLGANYPYRPMDRGFDEWLGIGDGGPGTSDDYFWNDRVNDTYWHNGERERREGYQPEVFYDAAVDYIENYDSDRPFFVYVPTYVPHGPHTIPDPAWIDYYVEQGRTKGEAYFFASIERVDARIGRIRDALAKRGFDENTIVIFLTDNGGTAGVNFYNAGMRGKKGSPYDGGHRVPCFIHCPSGTLGEPRDIGELTAHIDLLPTLMELCRLESPEPIDFDGLSLMPLLTGTEEETWPNRALGVEVQRTVEPVKGASSALMTQRWRLVNYRELYDMAADPGQKNNVAAENPDVVRELQQAFDAYWTRVTPGDREYPAPIIGTEHDRETYLGVSELRASSIWNHDHIASGRPGEGAWKVRIARPGDYTFDIRRWPKEAEAPMAELPEITKPVDAYDTRGEVPALLYGNRFAKLPVAYVRLQVGDFDETRPVAADASSERFTVALPAGPNEVTATLLDADKQPITSAYYVYVTRVE